MVRNPCRKNGRARASAVAVPAKSNVEGRKACAYSSGGADGSMYALLFMWTVVPMTMRRWVSLCVAGWRAERSVRCGERRAMRGQNIHTT